MPTIAFISKKALSIYGDPGLTIRCSEEEPRPGDPARYQGEVEIQA
jgi:hypothetical protein